MSKSSQGSRKTVPMPELSTHDIFDNAPIGIFTTTPDGHIISANAKLAEMFRYKSPKEMVESVSDIAAQLYADTADREEFKSLLEENGKITNHETKFRCKDGTELWGSVNVNTIRDKDGQIIAYQGFISDITEQKKAAEKLERLEWMMTSKHSSDIEVQSKPHNQDYGDLTELNRNGIILKSVGQERLESFAKDYMELLGTSSSIYEANGDYALGIFTSGWCRMMDCASRKLCKTPDNVRALKSERWLCHESCWNDCSKRAIEECSPVDIECHGGLRLYAVPIMASGKVVGAINFGYGNPPADPKRLQQLAKNYLLDFDDLAREAHAYDSRPPFIIELAKKRLHATARIIGSIIENKQTEEALRKSESFISKVMDHLPMGIAVNSVNPNVEFTYMNENFPKIYRTTREALSKPGAFWDVVYEDPVFREEIKNRVLEDISSGDPKRMSWEDVPFTRNGEGPFYICARDIPLEDNQMIISTVWDITDHKHTEEALRENKETLRITLRSIGDAVISTDMDGRVAAMNPVAESLTGWTEKEAAGKSLEIVFKIINEKTGNTVTSPVTSVLKSGNIVGLANHTLLIARDGRKIPIADSGAPIRNDAGDIIGVVLVFRDQTKERAARKALEESEAHYHQLFENMTSAFAVHEMIYDEQNNPIDYRFIRVNPAFEDIVGIPAEKTIGHTVKELLPATEEYWIKTYAQVVATGEPITFENYSQALDKHFDVRVFRPVPNQFAVVFQDITERKQAEEKLKVQYRLLKIAGETAKFGGWDVDLKTYISTWSDTVADIHEVPHGYAPPADRGMNFYAPEWRKRISQVFTDCAEKGIPYDEEMEIITAKGKRLWVRTIGSAVKDENGSIIKVHGAFQDITERKRIEQELKESEERFKSLHNASFGGITIHDKGVILECNQGLSEITGYTYDELIGMDGLLLISDATREMVMSNIKDGYEKPYEAEGVRKDGTVYPLRLEARNIRYKGKDVRVVEFRDITEQKQAEKEKEYLENQLRQAQKMESIGHLAGGVAHDFNNKLMGIMGYTELCRDSIGKEHPIRGYLDEIMVEAERSANLTRQLLAFARKQTIAPKVLDINDAITNILKMLRRLIGEDIDLVWVPGANLCQIKIDPGQIDQILANLCVNARDAISGIGKVTIETGNATIDEDYCTEHVEALPGKYVILAVSDDGCGMDRKTLKNIFEPFYTTKGIGKGTGLGLATVYGIVKQNNGFVNVYSEQGEGTTFRIYLPRIEEECTSTKTNTATGSKIGGTETILLVEDEKGVLLTLSRFLKILGYTVLSADSGEAALKLAADHGEAIQLMITDVVMPGMNGRNLAEKLANEYPEMKVLYMSGYTANVIAHRGILDNGVHFINKPISRNLLAAKVRETLDTD